MKTKQKNRNVAPAANYDLLDNILLKYDRLLLNTLYPAQYGYLKVAIEDIKQGVEVTVSDPFTSLALNMILCDYQMNITDNTK